MHLGAWKTRAAALTNRPFGSLVFDPTHLVRFVEHNHRFSCHVGVLPVGIAFFAMSLSRSTARSTPIIKV